MLQVKVSSQFRKAFLNYSENISTVKVEVLEKSINFAAREILHHFGGTCLLTVVKMYIYFWKENGISINSFIVNRSNLKITST